MNKFAIGFAVCASLGLFASPASSETVTYKFSGNDGLQSAAFNLVADRFIQPLTSIPFAFEPYPDAYKAMGEVYTASQASCFAGFTYRTGKCKNVYFALDVRYRDRPDRHDDVIIIDFGSDGAGFIYFDAGSFSTPGQHVSVAGYLNGALTVTGSTPVPEPATWATMTLGFGAIGFAVRRKKVAARPRCA